VRLHGIPRCFVYCTGGSLWLSACALAGSGSPLLVQPTLLQSLTAADIVESLSPDGQPLLGSMGLQPDMVDYFASRVQALTGGIGRTVQYVLRGRQAEVISSSPSLLQSHEDVDAVLERLQSGLAQIPSLLLRVNWDGPAKYAGEVPLWVLQMQYQRQNVRRFARMLLLDLPFDPDA
jgi:hypothetical protein